ncbi:MAG: hypothetical protein SGILL_006762, partial [Bacillariaceae sp.]
FLSSIMMIFERRQRSILSAVLLAFFAASHTANATLKLDRGHDVEESGRSLNDGHGHGEDLPFKNNPCGVFNESATSSAKTAASSPACPDGILTKRVVVVGAGVAGLTAAKRLVLGGQDMDCTELHVTLLEASDAIGGRIAKDTTFTEFTFDLGASWVYDKALLKYITQDDGILRKVSDQLVSLYELPDYDGDYFLSESGPHSNPKRFDLLWGNNFTWWDFLNEHVSSGIPSESIVYGCPVHTIQQKPSTGEIMVACGDKSNNNERTFIADHVIVTSSLSILLKEGTMIFDPPLPEFILEGRKPLVTGFKMYIEFSQKFYVDFANVGPAWLDTSVVQTLERTSPNVLCATAYHLSNKALRQMDDNDFLNIVLNELDQLYGYHGYKIATRSYQRHVTRVLSPESAPYLGGMYPRDYANNPTAGPQEAWPAFQLIVAGDAFPIPNSRPGWADTAALSGMHASEQILNEIDRDGDHFTIPESIWAQRVNWSYLS